MLPYPRGVAEELDEAEVVPGSQQLVVFSEAGSVDQTERRPDALAGRTQDTGPGGPVHLLKL